MADIKWSKWYPLTEECRAEDVPDAPGIFEIRTDYEFGRLVGTSRVVYIGSAANGKKPSLRVSLVKQRIGDPDRYLSRSEMALRYDDANKLEFRFATAIDGKTAKEMKIQWLNEYETHHWELPPGNSLLPQSQVMG